MAVKGRVVPAKSPVCTMSDALKTEAAQIALLRQRDPELHGDTALPLVGLALSGGGIRSATTCLGAVQALAENRSLRYLDYLSTVSGGGYIGAWFSALLCSRRRSAGIGQAIRDVEQLLVPGKARQRDEEAPEIAFLRAYSNYLTPRLGLFGADTLAAFTGYVGNLLLSMLLAVFSTGALLAALHLLMAFARWQATTPAVLAASVQCALFLFVGALVVVAASLLLQRFDLGSRVGRGRTGRQSLKLMDVFQKFLVVVMLPLLLFALLLGGTLLENGLWRRVDWKTSALASGAALFAIGIGATLAHEVFDAAAKMRGSIDIVDLAKRSWRVLRAIQGSFADLIWRYKSETARFVIAAAACAATAKLLIGLYAFVEVADPIVGLFRGPAIAAGIFCAILVVWMGVVGTTYAEPTREWLSRFLGSVVGLTLAWIAVGVFVVWARPLAYFAVRSFGAFGTAKQLLALQTVWIPPTAVLLLAMTMMMRRRPGAPGAPIAARSRVAGLAIGSACALVTALFLASMTIAFQELLTAISPVPPKIDGVHDPVLHDLTLAHLVDMERAIQWASREAAAADASFAASAMAHCGAAWVSMPALSLFLVLLLGAVIAYRYIDVNVYSLQNLYRNRLVRCYLGGARPRERLQNPYAGFDPDDDVPLSSLAHQRPFLLANAALNITQGDDLAWQQRKAASFCFSPLWCGYWLEATNLAGIVGHGRPKGGYAQTHKYAKEPVRSGESAGVMLGTVMATSGAAVSSQMGFASRGLLAFVLTLFNVRLGRWFPNSMWRADGVSPELGRHSPRWAGTWYLKELLGRTNEKSSWVYLSDGGHFDNLGIYELVRRRCSVIISVDAGADPAMGFGDLGNAVRKCRVDFGVDIRIDLKRFDVDPVSHRPTISHTVGHVHYPAQDGQPAFVGRIVYIKSSLPRGGDGIPADIQAFAAENPDFPHQTTANQWFTESQFESYRQLGYWITRHALADIEGP